MSASDPGRPAILPQEDSASTRYPQLDLALTALAAGATRWADTDPAATAATVDAEGFLHTGDIATVGASGEFYIVDRVKELIKYKGYQVAPAELEAPLLTHPAITDAAVIGVPDDEGQEIPKAIVVQSEGASLDAETVIAFVAERVSPHKKVRQPYRKK